MKKVVGFGELMVRLAPSGHLKFVQAVSFDVNYTGSEANVCVSLSNFGIPTSYVTKLPKNDIADCAVKKLHQFGVETSNIVWGGDRMGVYYLERGASQRPSKVVYDRKYSAFSQASPNDFDWDKIFDGAWWFHFTGLNPALGGNMVEISLEACKAAKKAGLTISCDLNYRRNLWSPEAARKIMPDLVRYCDLLIGNEEDVDLTMGMKAGSTDVTGGKLDYDGYTQLAEKIFKEYGIPAIAFTLRTSHSASDNGWSAMLYTGGKVFFPKEYAIHMVDRVGGGDSFAAGLIYAMSGNYDPQEAIEFATAASCLKQTMEMDFNLASVEDVCRLVDGDSSGRVQR